MPKRQKKPLSAMAEKFCREFCVDFVVGAAAKRAGYRGKSTAVTATGLLKDPRVRQRIRELQEPELKRLKIGRKRTLRELAASAFVDVVDLVDLSTGEPITDLRKLPIAVRRAISKFEIASYVDREGTEHRTVEVTLNPKLRALEMLMKNLNILGTETIVVQKALTLEELISVGSVSADRERAIDHRLDGSDGLEPTQ